MHFFTFFFPIVNTRYHNFNAELLSFIFFVNFLLQMPGMVPKQAGMPNSKLKPIFRDKFYKFSKTVAKEQAYSSSI